MAAEDETAEDQEDAEDGAEDGDGEEESGRKRLSGKMIVLIGGPVLVLLIGGIADFFFGTFDPLVDMVLGREPQVEGEAEAAPVEVMFYDLPEMLVNLKAGGKQTNFLKIRVALEVPKDESTDALDHLLPRVVDNFQVYLRELRLEDLDGSAGMFRIKEELLSRVNAAVHPIEVHDILFREMLVQ